MSNEFPDRGDQVVMAQLADDTRSPKRPNRWTILIIILGMAALVLGPILFMGVPREASRWNQAAAEEARLDGDNTLADEKMERALQWWPENVGALAKRAEWHLEDGAYEASLADYDRVLEIEKDNENAIYQRTLVYQHLGRHKEAIETWKSMVEKYHRAPRQQRATVLNGLAYAQAVGKLELDDALENAEKAVGLEGESPEILDTRGYIHLLRGDLDDAQKDLNKAVEAIEDKLKMALEIRQYYDQREHEASLDQLRHSVAVVVYHRSLLWNKKGDEEKAEADRQRVRELGFTPDEKLF